MSGHEFIDAGLTAFSMASVHPEDDWLTPREVAELTRVAVSTLKDRRWKGTGPKFTKLSPGRGGRIRYRRRDVEAWMHGEPMADAA